jgi:hypothetical protein
VKFELIFRSRRPRRSKERETISEIKIIRIDGLWDDMIKIIRMMDYGDDIMCFRHCKICILITAFLCMYT